MWYYETSDAVISLYTKIQKLYSFYSLSNVDKTLFNVKIITCMNLSDWYDYWPNK